MNDKIKISDLSVETLLKGLKEEIKKRNTESDGKINTAILVLVSIYNVLVESYNEVKNSK